jgi:hypothetical protein
VNGRGLGDLSLRQVGSDEVAERVMIGSISHDPARPALHARTQAVITRFEGGRAARDLGTPWAPLLRGQQLTPTSSTGRRAWACRALARTTPEAMDALGEAYVEARFGGSRKLERLRELFAERLDAAALETLLG